MFQAGSIISTLGLNISPFSAGILEANAIASVFPQTVTNFLANPILGFAGIVQQAMAAVNSALRQGLGLGVRLAAEYEQAEVAFTTMLGSAEAARQLLGEINDFAAATPFEMPELVAAAKSLLAFNVEANDMIPTMTALGDVSAGLGIPLRELAEVYGKAKVQGRLFMQDIAQLTGRGIPIIQELAKQFNVAEDAVRDLVSSGQVNFSHLEKAFMSLTGEGGKFAGLMAAQSQTLSGLYSTMTDNIGLALREVASSMIEALDIKGGMAGAIAAIESFTPAVLRVAQALGNILAAAIGRVMGLWQMLMPLVSRVGGLFDGMLSPLKAIGQVGQEVGRTVASAFQRIVASAGGIEGIMGRAAGVFRSVVQVGTALAHSIGDLLSRAINLLTPLWAGMQPAIQAVYEVFVSVCDFIATQLAPVIGEVLGGALSALGPILSGVGSLFTALSPIVEAWWGILRGLAAWILNVLRPILGALVSVLRVIGDVIGWVLDLISRMLKAISSSVLAITDWLGITNSAQSAARETTKAISDMAQAAASTATDAARTIGGSGGGEGSRPSAASVTIEAVNVDFDPAEASSQTAAKLRPHLEDAHARMRREMAGAAMADRVREEL